MHSSLKITLAAVMSFIWNDPLWALDSLCISGEETIFSCPVGHGKFVSVCAYEPEKGQLQIQYRLGRINQLELVLPEKPAEYANVVEGKQSSGARGGYSFVRFKRGKYSYVVHDLWGAGPECTPKSCANSGVLVEKSGVVISKQPCTGLATPFKDGSLLRLGIPVSESGPL